MLTLGRVLEALGGTQMAGGLQQVITDVVIDSRFAIPGSLFVALPGERADGHDFVEAAFSRGAAAALIQREPEGQGEFNILDLRGPVTPSRATELPQIPVCLRVDDTLTALQRLARYWRERIHPRVVGVTGSVGKTTTKELIASVLEARYRTLKTEGNLNNEIGLPLTLLKASEAHERLVLEMGFYKPGEIAFLCDLARPHVGVVTNVGVSHLEQAGTLEAIVQGKAELVQALPPDGTAILNRDDERVLAMAGLTRARVFTYGLDPASDLWASDVEGLGLDGIRLRLTYGRESVHTHVPLLGQHSAHTVLRAAAVGLVEGLTWEEIIHGLTTTTSQVRLVAVTGPRGSLILDDSYNASPESVIAALNLLHELEGRKVAVLGDMLELGSYEMRAHWRVGLRVGEVAQMLVTRGRRARVIAEAARFAGLPEGCVIELDTSEQVTAYLQQNIQAGDVVLVKGSH
ncbi:MAG: UDP-N-acetylmuramoyl-tripeptide--D-alanyl-D-alanine ligase, partial [Chloroflexi bacterium]|nr:UDP-N-acetylmuramoyl-tripeptide--D-alanyl-D-alanine ligase [Chloroflexota bacterium]